VREIKFKFWDTKNKTMHKNGCPYLAIDSSGNVSELIHHEAFLEWAGTVHTEHVIPLQYTGIKDKNGKEIYEGDVVLYDDYVGLTGVVYYDEAETSYIIKPMQNGDYEVLGLTCHVRVLGNIFENPELLEVAE